MPDTKAQQKKSTVSVIDAFSQLDKFLGEAVRQEDLLEVLKEITDALQKLEGRVSQNTAQTKDGLANDLAKLRADMMTLKGELDMQLHEEKGERMGKHQEMMQSMMGEMERIKAMIPEIPDHTERFMALEEGLARVPPQLMAEEVRDRLELLTEDERLDASAIKGLDAYIKKNTQTSGGGATIAGRDVFKDYDLSSQLDGNTKTFNIPAVWNIISVDTSSFPHALRKGIDYTWTPQSITFTDEIDAATTLAAGQTVILTIVTG